MASVIPAIVPMDASIGTTTQCTLPVSVSSLLYRDNNGVPSERLLRNKLMIPPIAIPIMNPASVHRSVSVRRDRP